MSTDSAALNGHTDTGGERPKIRIVVADDHPIFRDGLCKLLALEEDFQVVAQAQDGKQVLEVLQQFEPDVLLLDLKMPGLDGLATLQRLQAARNRTKVIVLTASEDKNEFIQAMKFGTSGIVLKQTATELLFKSIRKVYAGEIWLDSHTTAAVMRQFAAAEDPPAPGPPPARERPPLRAFARLSWDTRRAWLVPFLVYDRSSDRTLSTTPLTDR
jgi:two-component system NarL family response regulator